MDRTWFESFQGKCCEHRIGKARKPCDCKVYVPITAILTGKGKELKEKRALVLSDDLFDPPTN